MKALNCPNCGAALPTQSFKAEITVCEFCGATLHIPKTSNPEADKDSLLLSADFSGKVMPGWEIANEDKLSFHKGNPPELRGTFAPQYNVYYMLSSSGVFDNFDVSVNIKLTEGKPEMIRAGFFVRFTENGGYSFVVSAKSSYTFNLYIKGSKQELDIQPIMPWTNHSALRGGLNATNRLRVVCNGHRFRVYLNDMLASSFADTHHTKGKIYLVAIPGEESSLSLAFSDLQLKEVL